MVKIGNYTSPIEFLDRSWNSFSEVSRGPREPLWATTTTT